MHMEDIRCHISEQFFQDLDTGSYLIVIRSEVTKGREEKEEREPKKRWKSRTQETERSTLSF